MELVLEGGDDPEVAPAAAQSPEQVCVLGGTGCEHPTIGRDNLGGAEVVTSKAILAAQPAQAAAKCQPGDTGIGHRAPGGGEAKSLGCMIELAPQYPTLGPGRALYGVDLDALHW